MGSGFIQVFRDKKKEFRFRVKSRNGKIVAQSEGYKSIRGVEKGILACREIFLDYNIREVK